VDSGIVNQAVHNFEQVRAERLEYAKELVRQASSVDALLADIANVAMLLYIGRQIAKKPEGFQSSGK
jgi:hypothetical protein